VIECEPPLAAPVLELEQVFEPVRRRAPELELEPAASALERDAPGPDELVDERDAPERAVRIGQREERPVGGNDRPRRVSYFFSNFATTVLL
jgi:hypothetical protein